MEAPDPTKTMRAIAERIAEAKGGYAEIVDNGVGGFLVQSRWTPRNYLACPFVITVDGVGDVFVEQNRKDPFRHPFNEDMRETMKHLDNAMEGLITYGIKQGGDQFLIDWWGVGR